MIEGTLELRVSLVVVVGGRVVRFREWPIMSRPLGEILEEWDRPLEESK